MNYFATSNGRDVVKKLSEVNSYRNRYSIKEIWRIQHWAAARINENAYRTDKHMHVILKFDVFKNVTEQTGQTPAYITY